MVETVIACVQVLDAEVWQKVLAAVGVTLSTGLWLSSGLWLMWVALESIEGEE